MILLVSIISLYMTYCGSCSGSRGLYREFVSLNHNIKTLTVEVVVVEVVVVVVVYNKRSFRMFYNDF